MTNRQKCALLLERNFVRLSLGSPQESLTGRCCIMTVDTARIEQLIREARQGIILSRDELFSQSMPMLDLWSQSYERLLLRLRLSCRDLTQDVILVVQKNLHHFKGESASSWFAWLKRIHQRMLSNLIRQKASQITLEISQISKDEDQSAEELFVSKTNTPGSLVILKEQSERVKQVMNMMDSDRRQALNACMDGLTLEEHALLLGAKVHTVRYLRFKALQEFHGHWKKKQTAN